MHQQFVGWAQLERTCLRFRTAKKQLVTFTALFIYGYQRWHLPMVLLLNHLLHSSLVLLLDKVAADLEKAPNYELGHKFLLLSSNWLICLSPPRASQDSLGSLHI